MNCKDLNIIYKCAGCGMLKECFIQEWVDHFRNVSNKKESLTFLILEARKGFNTLYAEAALKLEWKQDYEWFQKMKTLL